MQHVNWNLYATLCIKENKGHITESYETDQFPITDFPCCEDGKEMSFMCNSKNI